KIVGAFGHHRPGDSIRLVMESFRRLQHPFLHLRTGISVAGDHPGGGGLGYSRHPGNLPQAMVRLPCQRRVSPSLAIISFFTAISSATFRDVIESTPKPA